MHESKLYFNLKDTLVIANLQDLTNPTILSRMPTKYQNMRKIIIRDNNIFIADWDAFYILDASNFDSLKELSSIQYAGRYASALAVKDNYAFLGNFDGLHVIDISDLLNPHEVNLLGGAPVADVVINNNYAYAASVYSGFRVIDISVPAYPVEVGSINTGSEVLGIAIKNNYVYLSNLKNGLRIIDISAPSTPQEVGFFNTEGNTYNSFIQDKYAYVADGHNGLVILDITAPSNPFKEAYSNYGGNATDLAVVNNIIYLADNINGFYIFKNDLITSISTKNLKTKNYGLDQNYPNPFNLISTRL
ncbi:MAG: LVIVD repeat-containing protein [Promethearchaeota archaeon]